MKVSELIGLLQMEDGDADVHFSYNYGDHWRTQVAPKVCNVEVGMVKYSDYHRMDKLISDEDFDYDDDGEPVVNGTQVVIIG